MRAVYQRLRSWYGLGIDSILGTLNSQNNGYKTPLHLASLKGHIEMTALLLSKGIDIAANDQWGYTALRCAADRGHKDVGEMLLNKGADVGLQDHSGWTTLYRAAKQGHKDTVKLLLTYVADVETLDEWRWTALHEAADKSHTSVELIQRMEATRCLAASADQELRHQHKGHVGICNLALCSALI